MPTDVSKQNQKAMETALFHLSYVLEQRLSPSEQRHLRRAKEALGLQLVRTRAEHQVVQKSLSGIHNVA